MTETDAPGLPEWLNERSLGLQYGDNPKGHAYAAGFRACIQDVAPYTRPSAPVAVEAIDKKITIDEAMRCLWDAGYKIHGSFGWVQDNRAATKALCGKDGE